MSGSQFVYLHRCVLLFMGNGRVAYRFHARFYSGCRCMFTVARGDQMNCAKRRTTPGAIAAEAIESIRTVFSFNGGWMAKRYGNALERQSKLQSA